MKKRVSLVVALLTLVLVCVVTLSGYSVSNDAFSVANLSIVNDSSIQSNDQDVLFGYRLRQKETLSSDDTRTVYLGGTPLGIDVKTRGVIIVGTSEVVTYDGIVEPFKNIPINSGDLIICIDGEKVNNEADVRQKIAGKKCITITIQSNEKINEYTVNTAIDLLTGECRLGLILRDGVRGIGTLTYIDKENMRYGALGHPIEENKVYRKGDIYNANIQGYVKGEKGKAGELDGEILTRERIGSIDKNTHYGIFGHYDGDVDNLNTIKTACRKDVHPGKAYIFTTIDGTKPQKYEIEIIKKVNQTKPQNKGLVLRITDKRLLDSTNGILQGMSGSPIIQNNRLIGAVTHVFVNDPTKGYGLYIDFMMDAD